MAEKKRKTTRGKATGKTGSKSRPSVAQREAQSAKTPPRPIRREVGGVVCLILGVLLLFGLFKGEGWINASLVMIFRGLVGSGVLILPFVLFIDFVILMFHDGRPVTLRLISSSVVVLCTGILIHLFGAVQNLNWSAGLIVELWQRGIDSACGGLLSGLLAMALELLVTKWPAALFTLVLLLITGLHCFGITPVSLARAIHNRPRLEYEPPKKEHADPAEQLVNHVAQKQIERVERKKAKISDFDLEVDEPPLPEADPEPVKPKKHKRQAFLDSLEDYEEKELPKAEPSKMPELILPDEPQKPSAKQRKFAQAVSATVRDEEEEELPPIAPLEDPNQKIKREEALLEAAKIASQIEQASEQQKTYAYPPLKLLRRGDGQTVDGTHEMQLNAQRLSDTLASFSIDAHIIDVIRGPSVTRYELELDRGVKLSKITNLADDIALSLGASGVRIAAIPDKISVVGIEVPNKQVSTVCIHDVIDSKEFDQGKSRLSFAVGKDISGACIIGDIAKLPHMLIAGTTGSGKSVCMNSLIISLLYKAKPEEVRMIMVDPKMVELGIYNGIPHLLIPVVTDPKKAAGALQWAVTEMMKRYRLMADAGARDLESYNKICGMQDDNREKLPQIVVVIDELADLMLVAAKEVEEAICRVAQMGRASGIHLVIATQRPSADVITGLMKANIPSRIAFAVASAMESRIILDTAGAEKLVGKGDMLYAPLGQGKPRRVQGCFITDDEVQDVVEFIKKNATASYDDDVMEQINQKAEQSGKSAGNSGAPAVEQVSEGDELLPAAVDVILETGQASVSMLQRRLKLGYARAARIVDEMEEKGIVGPFEGSKPRQLLITKEQWQQMQGIAPEEIPDEFEPPVEEEIL